MPLEVLPPLLVLAGLFIPLPEVVLLPKLLFLFPILTAATLGSIVELDIT